MTDYIFGIKWSAGQLAIASFKKSGKNNFLLEKLEYLPLAENDREENLSLIKQWLKNNYHHSIKPKAVLSLPESLVFLKELELPKVKSKELAQAVNWEVNSAATANEAMVVGWQVISEADGKVKLIAVYLREDKLRQITSVIEQAGFNLVAVEPGSFSFLRAAEVDREKLTLLVNIEEGETNFVVIDKGTPVFTSTASTYLRATKGERRKLSREIKAYLAAEARKALIYWENRSQRKIEQISLTGSGLRFSGLAAAINRFSHIPTNFARYQKITGVGTAGQTQLTLSKFLIPLGAALREIKQTDDKINLLPEKEKQAVTQASQRQNLNQIISRLDKVGLGILVVFILCLTGLKVWRYSYSQRIAQTKLFVANHPAQQLTDQINKTNILLAKLEAIVENQTQIKQKLEKIAALTPTTIRLTSIRMTDTPQENWEIKGVGDRIGVLAFYNQLKAELGAKTITMPYSNLSQDTGNDFVINILW